LLFSLAQSILARQAFHSTAKGGDFMFKKGAVVLFMVVLVFSLSIPGLAQSATKKEKEARVEGRIAHSDKDKSMFAVRVGVGNAERTVHYDASTKWVSQYHGDKKVNTIDASEVKDGDYVICVGKDDDKGEFHATMISKRLSHPK
jgi:hypothetical protein